MADATIGSTTIPLPLNYVNEPFKLETQTRTLDGSMIVNYAVNSEDTQMTKYHFEIPGIIKSERLTIRAEALLTGSLDYVDNITIPEVLVHTGSTASGSISLLRELGSTDSANITGTLADVTKTITVSTGVDPTSTGIYVTTGGALTVGSTASGNLKINYIPSYTVHILSDSHTIMQKSSTGGHITRYNLVLEEV